MAELNRISKRVTENTANEKRKEIGKLTEKSNRVTCTSGDEKNATDWSSDFFLCHCCCCNSATQRIPNPRKKQNKQKKPNLMSNVKGLWDIHKGPKCLYREKSQKI